MKNYLTYLLLLCSSLSVYATAPLDSLRTEWLNGKRMIVHQVEAKETFYSLVRRYHTTSADVIAANPSLKNGSALKVGQQIRFPYRSAQAATAKTPTQSSSNPTLHHIVENDETLYSIGKKYGLTAEQVRLLNDLSDNTIAIGQKLIVHASAKTGPAADDAAKPKKSVPAKTGAPDYVPNAPTGKRVTEVGIATTMETNRPTQKLLALHRYAPTGSLVRITNEATKASVVVKVLGQLPDTGNNENVLIRLTPAAYQKLQPLDSRVRAQIEYVLPPSR